MNPSDFVETYVQPIGKMVAVWSMTLYGVMTLHNLAVILGMTYSALQIYLLWRDKIRKPKD